MPNRKGELTIKYRGETLFAEWCPKCKKSSAVVGYGGGGKRWHKGKRQSSISCALSCGHNKTTWHNKEN
jgi:hypothetical protein